MNLNEAEAAIEAILFASGEPVSLDRICSALEIDGKTAEDICTSLSDEYGYQHRGIRLVRVEDSFQMCSAPEYADTVRRALANRQPPKLSQAALEVLAVVAYFQPVTRPYIDEVRGVDCSYTIGLLLERELIEEAGRLAVPGRPIQYRTTQNFLRVFGLRSLDELPELPVDEMEEGQITMEMQNRLEQLRIEQEAAGREDDPADPESVPSEEEPGEPGKEEDT
ncbi:MAG: SMC-Scp complex subunit ScpB [Oscillospiraceae bacterium]|nr:SMC-Scp complex subunit ScpB [Oscillospiraceae bacterium]